MKSDLNTSFGLCSTKVSRNMRCFNTTRNEQDSIILSVLVRDLHRSWYVLHFPASNLRTREAYKKNNLFLSKTLEYFTGKQYFSFKKQKKEMQKTEQFACRCTVSQ